MRMIKWKLNKKCTCEKPGLNIHIYSDNRNLVTSKLKSLEEYIGAQFIATEANNNKNNMAQYNVKASFVDSKANYLVQFADVIANALLISQKQNYKFISKDQIQQVKDNVKYSHFPSKKIKPNEKF